MEPDAFTTIEQSFQSGCAPNLEPWPMVHPLLLVFTEQSDFEQFWQQHKQGLQPMPAPPQIAFEDDMVLAALDNAERCSGYAIEIQAIETVDRFLRVSVVKTVPGSGCMVAWMTTRPFHLVRLPRSECEILLDISTVIVDGEDQEP
jgi:hypothetical protein